MYVHRNTGGTPREVPMMDFTVKGMLISDIRNLDIGTRRAFELFDVNVVFPKSIHRYQKMVFKGYTFDEAEMTGEAVYIASNVDLEVAKVEAHNYNASFSRQAIADGIVWKTNLVGADEKPLPNHEAQLRITEKEKVELNTIIAGFQTNLFPVYYWPIATAAYIKLSSAEEAAAILNAFFVYDMAVAEKRRAFAAAITQAPDVFKLSGIVDEIQASFEETPNRFKVTPTGL